MEATDTNVPDNEWTPTWIKQTKNTCGQTCVAMLVNVSLDESIKAFGKRGATGPRNVKVALSKFGYTCTGKLERLKAKQQLPSICLAKITWYYPDGNRYHYGHWCLYYHGRFYDPDNGVFSPGEYADKLHEYNGKITSFLEIKKDE